MKKKVLLLVALIAVITTASFIFAGCSHASVQGQLENIWLSNETFEYAVTDTSTPTTKTGTYVVKVKKMDKGTIAFGDGQLENAPAGYLVEADLAVESDTVKTQCYFKMVNGMKYVSSYATYRHEVINGKEFKMFGKYDGATLNFTKSYDGGEETKGSLSAREPFYDNNLIYQAIRSISNYSPSFQFSFNTPVVSATEDTVAQLNLVASNMEKVKNAYSDSLIVKDEKYKDGIDCYNMYLGRTASVVGMTHQVFIAKDDILINGWPIHQAVVKIVEPTNIDRHKGNVTYELKNITIE